MTASRRAGNGAPDAVMTRPACGYLTPADLAHELNVPLSTVRKWRHAGIDPAAIRIGKHVRYSRRDVDAWIRAHRTA